LRFYTQILPRDGRADLLLVSIEDVTGLRRAEMEAESLAGEALEDGRRRNEFLATLGHELRNPLAALSNGLELIRITEGEGIESVRGMMVRQTRRMTS